MLATAVDSCYGRSKMVANPGGIGPQGHPLAELKERISRATRRAGRRPEEVLLVGVAKGQPVERIVAAIAAGLTDVGENYAQELLSHLAELERAGKRQTSLPLAGPLRWHFVGHLQRNKVRQVIERVELIHSLDGVALAEEIDRRARAVDKVQRVLVEVRLGGEESKTGIEPEAVGGLVDRLTALPNITFEGLMTIPPPSEGTDRSRPFFRQLREIRDEIRKEKGYAPSWGELSMGMTHDFEAAIEEGATIVRIGTGLFGARA